MFYYKDITSLVENDIKSNQTLLEIIKNYNAFIAGGTALSLSKNINIDKYMQNNAGYSDVDLYFRKESDYVNAVNYLSNNNADMEKSATGMCHNLYFQNNIISKIQLVGCIFGNPEDVVKTFDFKNLEVFCYSKGENFFLGFSNNSIENKDMLVIRHSNSPFLMHRIYKYLNYKGYTFISKDSQIHITDWIIKASSGYYKENLDGCPSLYVDLLNNHIVKSMLKNRNIFSNENLVYMIGQIKESYEMSEKYIDRRGYEKFDMIKVKQKDVVIKEIQRRKKDENN